MAVRWWVLLGSVLVTGAAGAEVRHVGAHVHGRATVDISIENNMVAAELDLAGHDAVGFEHPPGTPPERAALARAKAVLQSGHWLEAARAADCHVAEAHVDAHGFDATDTSGAHVDLHADYRLLCAYPDKLNALDVRLVETFPSLQTVVVNVLSANGSHQQVLDPGVVRVDVQP